MDLLKLSNGSGKGQEELLNEIIIPILGLKNRTLEDSEIWNPNGHQIAFTTDSYVITPLIFPGGDIGKLAVCGTINDLCMRGAIPKVISVALILEEGLELNLLKQILRSLKQVCDKSDIQIICGDTKVVPKGKVDKIFINTSGIGIIQKNRDISVRNIQIGDSIIISGDIGRHGIAVLGKRDNYSFTTDIESDCHPLNEIVESLIIQIPGIHALRDATRGGVAAILNEMAKTCNFTFKIKEENIPIDKNVQSACSFLGLDPLSIANEGTFIMFVPKEYSNNVLKILKSFANCQNASIIGEVIEFNKFPVILETIIGAERIIEIPDGELLPRIC
ncbi:hydrogenase expression/formation protein HypE [bacterium B13(2017)]|nr:hydrogenase expression/formation protein HypE [bacterium B13(2017)]